MKVWNTAIAFAISSTSKKFVGVRADGELIASWVQFTGADMHQQECADLVLTPELGVTNIDSDCFFTAEVRAIYNDTAMMENPGCPNVLKVNGEVTHMSIRVNATKNFENYVSNSKAGALLILSIHFLISVSLTILYSLMIAIQIGVLRGSARKQGRHQHRT
jgi:hypothetical protein